MKKYTFWENIELFCAAIPHILCGESHFRHWVNFSLILPEAIRQAKKHTTSLNHKALAKFPVQIIQYAWAEVQEEESERKRVALLNKNLKQATPKLKEITQEKHAKIRELIGNIHVEKIEKLGANKKAGELANILLTRWDTLTANEPSLNRLFKKAPCKKTISRALKET